MFTFIYRALFALMAMSISVSLYAESFQHFRFHKNFKSYAMGGAGVVQHKSVMSMFSNPANLRNFPEDDIEGELFGTILGVNDNVTQFISDFNDANSGSTEEKNQQIFATIEQYTGKPLSAQMVLTPIALAFSSDLGFIDAQGIGLVTSIAADARTHSGFGSAGILEINSFNYGGLVYGLASDFEDYTVGLNIKLLNYFTLQREFSVAELIDNNLTDNIFDNDLKQGNSIAFDIGLNWDVAEGDHWSIVTGIVANNIGGIGDPANKRVYIPNTFDLGMRAHYDISSYNPIAFSIDYVDISNAYDDKGDFKKRLNYGFDLRLFKSDYIDVGVQAGMHQAEITYGGDLILLGVINFGYVSYNEELGVYAGQDPSKQDLYYFAFSF